MDNNRNGLSILYQGVEAHYIQISENIFISQIETRNLDYNMFLQSLKESGDTEKYYRCIPDSTGWINKTNYPFSEKYYKYYNSDQIYKYYPVVNISKEAMNLYCLWLIEIYENKGKKHQKIIVRLPTKLNGRSLLIHIIFHSSLGIRRQHLYLVENKNAQTHV